MTRKLIAVLIILSVAAAVTCLTADDRAIKTALSARGVTFDKWGYVLKLNRMASRCDVNLGGRSKKSPSTYSLDLKGICKLPGDVDAVVMAGQLRVLKVLDSAGKDLRVPPKPRTGTSARRYKTGTFGPIRTISPGLRAAEVGITRLALTANPYTIEKLQTELIVIVAKKRAVKTLPAAVAQKLQEVVDGLRIRISGMRMSAKRELTLDLAYTRPVAGPRGPFVSAIAALGADDSVLGQTEMTKGDPLGKTGKITAVFTLKGESKLTSVKMTIVTEHTIRKVPFELTGVFKK